MIKANFDIADVQNYITQQTERANRAVLETFFFAGEGFVRAARLKTAGDGGFNDVTGNLRSSIGYIVIQNGKTINSNFVASDNGSDRVTGLAKGLEFAEELATRYPNGIALICVAGMEYAVYVESKGRDVITGASLELETKIKTLLAAL